MPVSQAQVIQPPQDNFMQMMAMLQQAVQAKRQIRLSREQMKQQQTQFETSAKADAEQRALYSRQLDQADASLDWNKMSEMGRTMAAGLKADIDRQGGLRIASANDPEMVKNYLFAITLDNDRAEKLFKGITEQLMTPEDLERAIQLGQTGGTFEDTTGRPVGLDPTAERMTAPVGAPATPAVPNWNAMPLKAQQPAQPGASAWDAARGVVPGGQGRSIQTMSRVAAPPIPPTTVEPGQQQAPPRAPSRSSGIAGAPAGPVPGSTQQPVPPQAPIRGAPSGGWMDPIAEPVEQPKPLPTWDEIKERRSVSETPVPEQGAGATGMEGAPTPSYSDAIEKMTSGEGMTEGELEGLLVSDKALEALGDIRGVINGILQGKGWEDIPGKSKKAWMLFSGEAKTVSYRVRKEIGPKAKDFFERLGVTPESVARVMTQVSQNIPEDIPMAERLTAVTPGAEERYRSDMTIRALAGDLGIKTEQLKLSAEGLSIDGLAQMADGYLRYLATLSTGNKEIEQAMGLVGTLGPVLLRYTEEKLKGVTDPVQIDTILAGLRKGDPIFGPLEEGLHVLMRGLGLANVMNVVSKQYTPREQLNWWQNTVRRGIVLNRLTTEGVSKRVVPSGAAAVSPDASAAAAAALVEELLGGGTP